MKQGITGVAVALSLMLAATLAHAQQIYPDHSQYWGGGWGWGHMIFGPLMMIVVIAVVVVVVVLAVRWIGGSGHGAVAHPPSGKTPLDILKERFARGEIDKEEFEERKRLLSD